MKALLSMLLFSGCLAAAPALAWGEPDPITLAIPHFEQEGNNWCWAALVQQSIAWRGLGEPYQCQIVGMANAARELMPFDCCANQADSNCNRTGTVPEIRSLIQAYGGRAESVSPPGTPEELHSYLRNQKALICGVRVDAVNNHIYLVKGLYWENGRAMLLINDPAFPAPRRESFDEARATWVETLAVE
ncbi:MAG: hypothetical protein LBP33_10935 [Candidatus Adiutrix sp.]|jgi:hypothetical protein|nr:hypothetical protein [Candidatus Adiutrix sp.]